ncbi:hypothetical protein HanXRQr2_Chr09g0397181 [Helianthus annuus]|uniref:Uncharacterized protein n=1 Tax=Helianthus annuus TaxID=4232 RepID=A0A9K3I729_HELAN|nr:hypothetical protein HanXRQr2_Chr09g0397181 [Helianthus annuus]KAJ0535199.1 hypothetical protein HanIR_Chr09g0428101 [Helianthus annuus]KAJ0893895.1 hypothetical protein HanPSC8_Chr09g0382941 [Helianthus annuus]
MGVIDDALVCFLGGRHPGASSLLSSSSGGFKRPTFTGDRQLSYIATFFSSILGKMRMLDVPEMNNINF